MGLFSMFKKKDSKERPFAPATEVKQPEVKEPTVDEFLFYNFKIAGTSFREKEIVKNLAFENDDYSMSKKELIEDDRVDERIYQYFFDIGKVELVPEPDNPEDENAVKVIADGTHIGYVPASKAKKVKKILEKETIIQTTCEMSGGKFKLLTEEETDSGKETYELVTEGHNIGGSVTIKYKNPKWVGA